MQLLSKMNAKMDQGYKLTNFYCTFCKGVTLAKPNDSAGNVYCPKCNKQYVPVSQPQQNTNQNGQQQDYDEMYENIQMQSNKKQNIMRKKQNEITSQNSTNKKEEKYQNYQQQQDYAQKQYKQFLLNYNNQTKTKQQLKSQQISKKIGQKLIAGWAMMEQACMDCNVPLMKSKNGKLICCGCEKDYSKKQSNNIKDNNNKGKNNEKKQQENIKNVQITKQIKNISQPKSQTITNSFIKQNQNSNINNNNNLSSQQRISVMVNKTLTFLQSKLDLAIQMNDLQAIDKVLKSIKSAKQLMN